MTAPGAVEERLSRALAWLASVWLLLASAWEIAGPPLAGHYASSASVGIIADNMLRWHVAGPVWEYTQKAPGPDLYYCHHPWGIFWTTSALVWLFGRHAFVLRLAPVLLSAATPLLLHALGKAIWRPIAGAAAAVAFCVLPITLAFANFNALEVPVIAWSLLGLWGYVRLTQTGRRRWLAVSLTGFFFALHADWPAFVLVAELLFLGLFRGFLLRPSLFGVRARRQAQWWALLTTLAGSTFLLYLYLFNKSGKISDLLGSAGMRSAGNGAPLAAVLASRRYWIELMFTPAAILLGKIMTVVILFRWLWQRSSHEALPLALLGMATVQYVVFKEGADVHIFWPHYFAAYFALAMGALAATLAPLLERAKSRFWPTRSLHAEAPVLLALALTLLPLGLVLRDGVPALGQARATGGRFNEKGNLIQTDGDKTAFLEWLEPSLPRDRIVDMSESMQTTWSQVWILGGRVVSPNRAAPKGPAKDGRDTYLADARFLADDVQQDLAAHFHVVAVGSFWKINRNDPPAPIDGYSLRETEPSLLEWYFLSGTEPRREVVPDPFVTWELRHHFGQPAEPPVDEPRTLEQRRIAHNVALAQGDTARAAALEAQIRSELDAPGALFDDGTELVGVKYSGGVAPRLQILFKANGPLPAGAQPVIRAKVTAAPALSTTMADPVEREIGLPLSIAPERWKPGFLYLDPVPIQKRPGKEIYRASFQSRARGKAPAPLDGQPAITVLTLQ